MFRRQFRHKEPMGALAHQAGLLQTRFAVAVAAAVRLAQEILPSLELAAAMAAMERQAAFLAQASHTRAVEAADM